MRLERRSVFGWPATAAGWAPCKNGLVLHYDGSNQSLANKQHSSCRTYWKNTRRFHMDSRRWLDIGYSFGVCPHGYVFEGRGWQRQQAAQPGGNSSWTSCTFMSGPAEKPTSAQVAAFRELRAWLRGKGLAAAVSYHGRFISTSCPGSILRGMVTSGSLISGSTPKPPQEEDMAFTAEDKKWLEALVRKVVHEEVYEADVIPNAGSNPDDPFDPKGNPGLDPAKNPTIKGESAVKQTLQGLIVIDGKLDGLASTGGVIDVDAFVAKVAPAVADEVARRMES